MNWLLSALFAGWTYSDIIELSTTTGTVGKEGLYSFKTGLHCLTTVEQESSSGKMLPVKILESEAFSSL